MIHNHESHRIRGNSGCLPKIVVDKKVLQQTSWRYHSEDRSDCSTTLGWMMAPLKGIHRSLTWTPYNCHLEERIDLESIMFRSFSFHMNFRECRPCRLSCSSYVFVLCGSRLLKSLITDNTQKGYKGSTSKLQNFWITTANNYHSRNKDTNGN